MKPQVFAIALDAFSPVLLEAWMAAGHLPNLSALRARGAYGRLRNPEQYLYENSWLSFLHGATPGTSGQWGHQRYDASSYALEELPAYDFGGTRPFYTGEDAPRTAVFDLPLTRVSAGVNGIQAFGWGTEANQCLRDSDPPDLMGNLLATHGDYPVFEGLGLRVLSEQDGTAMAFRNPSIYDLDALLDLKDRLIQGMRGRTAIILDLAGRESWDLLLAAYAEMHMASHLLWHLSLDHPLRERFVDRLAGADPLLDVARVLDACVGELAAGLPHHASLVLFAVHGMKANNIDLASSLFLPEFLFRWSHGRAALADGRPGGPVPELAVEGTRHWKDEVWALRTPAGEAALESPQTQEHRRDPLDWNPANWYRQAWKSMKAFALPSYSHGMVRVNVRGRDGQGIVDPCDFAATCERLTGELLTLVDARSGKPLVKEVLRTRREAGDPGPLAPPADLIVVWGDEAPADCAESPSMGRIGPVPFFRSGGHAPSGFCLAVGPGIDGARALPANASAPDLTASLLQLLGQPRPVPMEGRGWWG